VTVVTYLIVLVQHQGRQPCMRISYALALNHGFFLFCIAAYMLYKSEAGDGVTGRRPDAMISAFPCL
jgi:hypothetical protein